MVADLSVKGEQVYGLVWLAAFPDMRLARGDGLHG